MEEVSPQKKKLPDLQAQMERGVRFSQSLSRMKVYGNRPEVQPKLAIGVPGDKYELEADRVATDVVNQINAPVTQQSRQNLQREEMAEEDNLMMKSDNSTIQREVMPEEEIKMKPMLQLQPSEGGMAATPDLETSLQQARGSGQPLADQIREPMQQAFRADFSGVKVHTDAQSDQLNRSIQARAFTTGQDVFFRSGEYNPGSRGGQELLAHELTHVVQQTGSIQAKPNIQEQNLDNEEAKRVAKLETDYKAAVNEGRLQEAATLLNGFNDADIQSKLNKLSHIERRGMYFAALEWVTRVKEGIASLDPEVKKSADITDDQLKQIDQEKNSEGVTVALYANYDYGKPKTRSNNKAFFDESKRFAENQEAIGLKGDRISIGVAIPIDEVSDVIVAVQSIHRGLVAKWQQSQTQAGGNQPTAAVTTPPGFTQVRNLALFAHGESWGIGMDKKNDFKLHSTQRGINAPNVKAFVSGLTGAVAKNVRVQLFSCNAARGQHEDPEWGEPTQGERKGNDSFATALAEALGSDASVYAHTAAAHTTEMTSARVFGKDAGVGTGGLHIFDLLYDETFIQSELSRLFPNTTNPYLDLAALHDSLRDQMWKHYQHKMYDFKDLVQPDGSTKKQGVPKVYGVGQHTLGQEQFVNVDGAKSTLHQDWTDVWIPAHLSEVKTNEEAKRVAKLETNYKAAVKEGRLQEAATLLNGFNDTDIQSNALLSL